MTVLASQCHQLLRFGHNKEVNILKPISSCTKWVNSSKAYQSARRTFIILLKQVAFFLLLLTTLGLLPQPQILCANVYNSPMPFLDSGFQVFLCSSRSIKITIMKILQSGLSLQKHSFCEQNSCPSYKAYFSSQTSINSLLITPASMISSMFELELLWEGR